MEAFFLVVFQILFGLACVGLYIVSIAWVWHSEPFWNALSGTCFITMVWSALGILAVWIHEGW